MYSDNTYILATVISISRSLTWILAGNHVLLLNNKPHAQTNGGDEREKLLSHCNSDRYSVGWKLRQYIVEDV